MLRITHVRVFTRDLSLEGKVRPINPKTLQHLAQMLRNGALETAINQIATDDTEIWAHATLHNNGMMVEITREQPILDGHVIAMGQGKNWKPKLGRNQRITSIDGIPQ